MRDVKCDTLLHSQYVLISPTELTFSNTNRSDGKYVWISQTHAKNVHMQIYIYKPLRFIKIWYTKNQNKKLGSMVVQWLVMSPHSKKVPGAISG